MPPRVSSVSSAKVSKRSGALINQAPKCLMRLSAQVPFKCPSVSSAQVLWVPTCLKYPSSATSTPQVSKSLTFTDFRNTCLFAFLGNLWNIMLILHCQVFIRQGNLSQLNLSDVFFKRAFLKYVWHWYQLKWFITGKNIDHQSFFN